MTRLDATPLEDRLAPAALGVYAEEYAPGRLLVAASVAPPHSVRLADGVYRVELPKGSSVPAKTTWVYTLPGVRAVQPDFRIRPASVPSDPLYPQQYAHAVIGSPAAWDAARGTGATVVAVIDTGVDVTHPDLAANVWRNPGEAANGLDDDGNGFVDDLHGWDFVGNDNTPEDGYVHGTHVAGVLGAVGNNGIGVTGVAWTTRVMALKIFDSAGGGWIGDALEALDYAVRMGARVSNHSYGGGGGAVVEWAFRRAMDAGHVVVASAGNDGADMRNFDTYPASIGGVISVGAEEPWSNYDTSPNPADRDVTLTAPGRDILGPRYGSYNNASGTSFSAPHVAGALVVLWDSKPTLTAAQLVQRLKATAAPVPSQAGRSQTGGRLDFAALVSPPVVPNEPRTGFEASPAVALLPAPDGAGAN